MSFALPLEMIVPELLTPRNTTFSFAIGLALFLAMFFLALARASQPNIYASVALGLVKTTGVRGFVRDAMPFNGRASIMLLLNYWISTGLVVYLLAGHLGWKGIEHWLMAIVSPWALLLLHLGSLVLSGWIVGERDVFRPPFMMKLLGAQFLGIVYFICALIWVLRPQYVDFTIQAVLWLFLLESAFRIVKSISVVLGMGVSWYYIILYFCTLEILPLLIAYYYLAQGLKG